MSQHPCHHFRPTAPSCDGGVESSDARQEALSRLEATLSELGKRFRDYRPGPLTPVQLSALRFLLFAGPVTIGTLSRAIALSFSSTTGMVDRLAQLGLVHRLHPEKDRRTVVVRATEAGRDVVKAVMEDRIDFVGSIFAGVPAEDLLRLHAFLERVLQWNRRGAGDGVDRASRRGERDGSRG